jgi:hypothetical protein
MIEIRIPKNGVVCISTNDVMNSISMINTLKIAGVPFEGILLARGITHGVLTWHTEEDLESDTWVIRWFEDGDALSVKPLAETMTANEFRAIRWNDDRGFRWVNLNESEDEL